MEIHIVNSRLDSAAALSKRTHPAQTAGSKNEIRETHSVHSLYPTMLLYKAYIWYTELGSTTLSMSRDSIWKTKIGTLNNHQAAQKKKN